MNAWCSETGSTEFDGFLDEYDAPGEDRIKCTVYSKSMEYDDRTRGEMDRRFLYSVESLRGKRMLVVGAGTLGNEVVKDAAFSGVQDITVVDPDRYEYYNLPRSTLIRNGDVGQPKALALAYRAVDASPFDLRATGIVADITRLGWGFLEGFDIVLSPVDSWSIRSYVSRGAQMMGVPHVSCGTSVLGFGSMSMMGTAITVEPKGCRACYECMVHGNLKDQEKKLSCLDIEPETQPQVLSFSSVSAGFATQTAVNILLGRFRDGSGSGADPKACSYQIRELGRTDDSDGNTVFTTRSSPDPGCSFHSGLAASSGYEEAVLPRGCSIRDLWNEMNRIFGHEGVYEMDLRWSALYYMVYPEGRTEDEDRIPPVNAIPLDDRDDEEMDRFVLDRLPPDHIYMVTDSSSLDPVVRIVRIRFESQTP